MKRLTCIVLMMFFLQAQAGDEWSIPRHSLDSGGVIAATGGGWALSGTIGQSDATVAHAGTGGDWMLTGGFWGWLAEYLDAMFADRFEGSAEKGPAAPTGQ